MSGVGHFTCSGSDTEKSSLVEPFNLFAQTVAHSDFDILPCPKDEHPLPHMRRPSFLRREQSPRWLATAVFHSVSEQSQFGKDLTQSEADMSFHILKPDESGSNNLNCPPHKRPEMPRVILSFSLPRAAERRARVTRKEHVHQS